jgi:hypothetical protein
VLDEKSESSEGVCALETLPGEREIGEQFHISRPGRAEKARCVSKNDYRQLNCELSELRFAFWRVNGIWRRE